MARRQVDTKIAFSGTSEESDRKCKNRVDTDELRQAVLAAAALEHLSVNTASLIHTKIICAKITCISILYFTIKPGDYSADREKPP